MIYIEPPYQLPMQAESLHTWEKLGENLVSAVASAMREIAQAFAPAIQAFVTVETVFAEAVEDALRDNAYHPTGSVIRSTAFTLPDEYSEAWVPKIAPQITNQNLDALGPHGCSDYNVGDHISFADAEQGQPLMGEIIRVVPPGRTVTGRQHPTTLWVDCGDGFPHCVYLSQLIEKNSHL